MRQLDSFSADVQGKKIINVDYIIKGLAQYFPPVNLLSKKKRHVPWNEKKMCTNCKMLCGTSN